MANQGIKNILDHWHPILPSDQLKNKPVEIQLAGQPIVLFRDKQQVGALSTRCPHRGMNLSHGKVQKDGLSCLYHGWTYAADGTGQSPCNPKLKVRTLAYDVREYAGFIWLSGQNSGAEFPEFILPGFEKVGVHVRTVEAPLEPVMDNFLEVEHFPTAHGWLGVDFQNLAQTEMVFASSQEHVKMGYYPAEQLTKYSPLRLIFNLPAGCRYFMDITAYNSPLYSIHHQGFLDPATGIKKTILINGVFYVPINKQQTLLVMFLLSEPGHLSLIKDAVIRKETGRLIEDDLVILNHLADKHMSVKDMRLGYYDKALIEVRKRLPRIYADYYQPVMGQTTSPPSAPEDQAPTEVDTAEIAPRANFIET